MTRPPRGAAFLVSIIATVAALPAAQAAAPTAETMLNFKPHQQGVNCSKPAPHEIALCKVELVSGSRPGSSGWMLRDARGQPLRRFMDTAGTHHVDLWCYYLDGIEVYRDLASAPGGKIDQYRWMNAGGSKWGVDLDHDDKIDSWKMISPEEASQEVFQAVISKDFARLQALWITDAEIKELELPASEVSRLSTLKQQAQAKFQATCAKLALTSTAHWERFESAGPNPPALSPGSLCSQQMSPALESKA